MTDVMPMLEKGIAHKNWELVALCLIVRVAEAINEGSEEAVEEMIEALTVGFDERPSRRKGRCRGRR